MKRPESWRRRWRTWWDDRHPRTDELVLTQRRIYILPTGAGWLFALLLLCLLLASINYQLNLGHLLTFALASAAVMGLHATHATLRGLHLSARACEPGFAGEAVGVEITLRDPAGPAPGWRRPLRLGRHGLGLRWRDGPHPAGDPVWAFVEPGGQTVLRMDILPARRGRQTLPALEIASRFPLGLFRAWSIWRIAVQPLAWPKPEADPPPLPPHPAEAGEPARATVRHGPPPEPGDEAGVRPWRREDSPSQVHWKLSARSLAAGGGLQVRERPPPRPPGAELHLDGHAMPGLDPEARLSRLAAWVLEADRLGQPYRMTLRPLRTEPGSGPAHRRHCLDALATWEGGA